MWKYSEEYNGHFKSKVYWVIPFLLAYGTRRINNKVKIHTLNGSKQIKR